MVSDPSDRAALVELRKGVQSVEQGARLLEALIRSRRALPLRLLAQMADMSPSTAHRYLASFIRVELIVQDPATGHYDLGTLALRLGLAALNRNDFIQIADDHLRELTLHLNMDGHISVWGDYGATIIRQRDTIVPFLNVRLGGVLPLIRSATGQIFLAYQSRDKTRPLLQAELARFERDRPSEADIDRMLDEVRANGFATIDGTMVAGLRAVSAPILDLQGNLRAAISLVSSDPGIVRVPNDAIGSLIEAAAAISRKLGWEPEGKLSSS